METILIFYERSYHAEIIVEMLANWWFCKNRHFLYHEKLVIHGNYMEYPCDVIFWPECNSVMNIQRRKAISKIESH